MCLLACESVESARVPESKPRMRSKVRTRWLFFISLTCIYAFPSANLGSLPIYHFKF